MMNPTQLPTWLSDQIEDWRYSYGELLAICIVNGATQEKAEAIAAQQIGAKAVTRFLLDIPPKFKNGATAQVFESVKDDSKAHHPVSRFPSSKGTPHDAMGS